MTILLMAALEGLPVQPQAQPLTLPVLSRSPSLYLPSVAAVPRKLRTRSQMVTLVRTAPSTAKDVEQWVSWLRAHW